MANYLTYPRGRIRVPGYIPGVQPVTAFMHVWSSGGALAAARHGLGGAGTQTAGLSFGGFGGANLATTEEYDGTSWSSGGALATARNASGGEGAQEVALSFGGNNATGELFTTEEYN